MKIKWENITDGLRVCKVENNGLIHKFTLTTQKIGVYGSGRALVLRGKIIDDEPKVICALWTKDDGYGKYRETGHKNKLWTEQSAIDESIEIMKHLVETVY